LLAEVYIELTGGRQRGLSLAVEATSSIARYEMRADRAVRPILVSEEEEARHAEFLVQIKNPIWQSAVGGNA
jgi:DNA polymerase III subunit epsilon